MKYFYTPYDVLYQKGSNLDEKAQEVPRAPLLMIKPQHADVFEAMDSHLKLRLLRSQTKK